MIIADDISNPMPVSIDGKPPRQMKLRLVTFELQSIKDVEEFSAEMLKGRDMVLTFEIKGNTCVMLREFIPVKIDTTPFIPPEAKP